ncbi:hypothetical protein [Meiothermus taiwanensis]|uniref:Uncharacterized protein n=1 Tax=Meiothermus taiwanensis TaxID=172827 RepID=A0A399E2Y2_9DEIN|nr:hypothetical protein [Meiothermus taiwanensis]RIH79027.1 hypothetical protein Mcate_00540 [Meiothermus taiwanensis]
MNPEIQAQIEAIRQRNPQLAQILLRTHEALKKRESGEDAVQDAKNPPSKTPDKAPPASPATSDTHAPSQGLSKGLTEAESFQKNTPAPDREEVRRFEWQDLLSKAEDLIRKAGDWEALGPLRPLVRLLVAFALREGARHVPEREATVFLAQWELARMLEISDRTLERWLNDARYESYRGVAQDWIAWETWMVSGEGIGKNHAVRGGTVWRVRVKPIRRSFGRKIRVLAPYLALPWRNLAEDRQEGRTERAANANPDTMSGYKRLHQLGKGLTLQSIVGKPLITQRKKHPLSLYPDTQTSRDLRELLRVASIPNRREGRRSWARDTAAAIARALGDQKSMAFWLRIVWSALRVIIYGGGEGVLRVLFRVVSIASEARQDGFARSAGAYAHYLLGKEGYFELVSPFAAYRVG